jgi:hypothetical protein
MVSLGLSLVFKTIFGMLLAPLVCLKSIQYEMSGNFQYRSQVTLIPSSEKVFLEFKNIILEEKLSN